MAKNQFRDITEPLEAKTRKRSSKKGSSGKTKQSQTKTAANVKKALGLTFCVVSIFLLIALLSYFFTGKHDFDVLNNNPSGVVFNPDVEVQNWLGRLGAWIGQKFAYEGFGLASFLFAPWFFMVGIRLLLGHGLLKNGKLTRQLMLGLVFISLFLGFFVPGKPILGGAFGRYLTEVLVGFMGSIGTGILIVFLVIAYLLFQFSIEPVKVFEKIQAWRARRKAKTALLKEDIHEEEKLYIKDTPVDAMVENVYVHADEIDAINPENDADTEYSTERELTLEMDETSDPEDASIDKDAKSSETSHRDASDDIGLTVENTSGKEVLLSDQEIKQKSKALVDEVGEYDPRLELSNYRFPTLQLLKTYGEGEIVSISQEEHEKNKNKIVSTLGNYNISIARIKATPGPTVTLYEIVPAPGVRISKIKNLEDDIALSLSALGIRIIAPIPGKGTVGIEVPNSKSSIVSMHSLISSEKFQNSKMELPFALGKTISNETFIADLAKMPHLLMAGATGQGKSVGLNAILVSLIYKKHPAEVKFVLVDPKKVELTLYNKIERHFLARLPGEEEAIITDTSHVVKTLHSLTIEMDLRYNLLKDAQVRNIKEYNAKFIQRRLNPEQGHRYLPYIVLVVDEFADLIMTAGKEIEGPIARLAQLARAIGIHLIIATQRPSVNIITGSIKANFPARIAYRVTSKIDSRTILDTGGADQLIGRGDMLLTTGQELVRLQCGFVDLPEVDEITTFIGSQKAYPDAWMLPEYVGDESGNTDGFDAEDRDDKFEEAARIVVIHQQGSASLLQRKLKLGYNRAGRIIDQLEAAGIIGPFEGSKARQVLIQDELSLEQLLNDLI
jgi:S-DNA-T family DNA segregation ATPase FtsK/SpoIIIE